MTFFPARLAGFSAVRATVAVAVAALLPFAFFSAAPVPEAKAQSPSQEEVEGEDWSTPQPVKSSAITKKLIETYKETGRAKTIQQGGTVVYPFGESNPIVTCAPLRACIIELKDGEKVLSIIAGDTERWMVQQSYTGSGGNTPLIVLKPLKWDISTNMVISTNERVYNLMIDAPPKKEGADEMNPSQAYTEHVSFYYPQQLVQQQVREEKLAEMQKKEEEREEESTITLGGGESSSSAGGGSATSSGRPTVSEEQLENVAGVSVEDLNFDYRWSTENDYPWEPVEVFDDGKHTYIKVPDPALNGSELPLLFSLGRAGEMQMVNYTVRNGTFVTGKVIDDAVLVLGVEKRGGFLGLGEKKRVKAKLEIHNNQP